MAKKDRGGKFNESKGEKTMILTETEADAYLAARGMFEQYCKEGVRPLMYDLTRLAGGEYASPFTEWAWKIYWKGINDAGGAW